VGGSGRPPRPSGYVKEEEPTSLQARGKQERGSRGHVLVVGSREERFLAEFDDAVARIGVVGAAAYARDGGWREKVRAGLASVLWLMVDEPGLGAEVVECQATPPRGWQRLSQWAGMTLSDF
jgi:hypothetical protein